MLFDTFGPGDSYDTGHYWTIGGGWTQGEQFSFAGSQSYLLDSIELGAGVCTGDNQLTVSLMDDAAGQPGAVLESFSFIGQMGSVWTLNPPVVGVSVSRPLLTPDTQYWLVASSASDGIKGWNWSSPVVEGLHTKSLLGSAWNSDSATLGACRINGTPLAVVPVPSAIVLVMIGLGSAHGLLRRRTA